MLADRHRRSRPAAAACDALSALQVHLGPYTCRRWGWGLNLARFYRRTKAITISKAISAMMMSSSECATPSCARSYNVRAISETAR